MGLDKGQFSGTEPGDELLVQTWRAQIKSDGHGLEQERETVDWFSGGKQLPARVADGKVHLLR